MWSPGRSRFGAPFATYLGQAPLNLERNVSVEAVREFKLVTHAVIDAIVVSVRNLLPTLSGRDVVDVIAAATSLSGAFWPMATRHQSVW